MLLQTFRDSKANTTTAEAKAGPGAMSKNIKKQIKKYRVIHVPYITGQQRKSPSETAGFMESTKPEI